MSAGQSHILCGVRELACQRGGRMLFAGVNFTVGVGDMLWLRGPNAIGKSSLMRIVSGLLPHFSGQVDRPVALSLLDDRTTLDMDVTVHGALTFWAALDDGIDRISPAMADMGIAHLADVPMRFLSQGQRKRAGMARVIASGAVLWLLDEPANGLDVDGVAQLVTAIAAHRAGGGAVLLASHIDLMVPDTGTIDMADYAIAEYDADFA